MSREIANTAEEQLSELKVKDRTLKINYVQCCICSTEVVARVKLISENITARELRQIFLCSAQSFFFWYDRIR